MSCPEGGGGLKAQQQSVGVVHEQHSRVRQREMANIYTDDWISLI